MAPFTRRKKAARIAQAVDKFVDEPTTNDDLTFKRFVNPIAEIIGKDDSAHTPLTIGVYGEWGSGKTSFLKMVAVRLTQKQIYPIWFTAWKYDKEENLWSALLQAILNQAGEQGYWFRNIWVKFQIWRYGLSLGTGTWEVAKKLLFLLLRVLVILLCAYVIFGVDSKEIANFLNAWLSAHQVFPPVIHPYLINIILGFVALGAADLPKLIDLFRGDIRFDFSKFERKLSFRDHIAFLDEFSDEFQKLIRLLRSGNKPLVVIIDDLDRCLPQKVLQVLEAIKIFLDIPGSVFLLGLDKKIVERAVAEKYKELSALENEAHKTELYAVDHHRRKVFHEDYIDKIVQLSIVVPQLRETEIGDFIKKLNKDVDSHVVDQDIEKCADIFGVGLSPNPRKIKRIIRAFRFVRDVVDVSMQEDNIQRGDIKVSILAKLIVIQNQLPTIYEMLVEQPLLLEELEAYYRKHVGEHIQASSASDANEDAGAPSPIIRDRAESYAREYPELTRLLLKEIDADDTFAVANIHLYIYWIGTFAHIGPLLRKQTLPGNTIYPGDEQPSSDIYIASSAPTVPVSISPATSQRIWNVPSRRNPLFTAQEGILRLLHDKFAQKASLLPIAVCGLGGIGKTQIAIEYAYRYGQEYDAIFWVQAESYERCVASFVAIADLLNLPEKNEQDQNRVIVAVRSWLDSQPNWLLILDGVTNLEMIRAFLPLMSSGHVLLTTRLQTLEPTILSIDIDNLRIEEGVLLLLRRARIISRDSLLSEASAHDLDKARQIVQMLDGLPLAIDQAGAYIEETGCRLSDYLELYQTRSALLLKRRGGFGSDHPEPVATTWSLSFEKLQQANPAAADLLSMCAFLDPDAIPEEIIREGAPELGPALEHIAADPYALNNAIGELRKFSLLRRDPERKLLLVHRLVQGVLKDAMHEEIQRTWAERVVRVINHIFPAVEYATWPGCQRYLSQALVCAELVTQWDMCIPEAAQLLDRTGSYLRERVRYIEAKKLLEQALAIREQILGTEHPDVATNLNNLALLYHAQGKYVEAEPLYQRALAIRQQVLGAEHPDVATNLNNLALLYHAQGKYVEAEPLYQKALAIFEQTLGAEHSDVATNLNNLALLYHAQNRYAEAEPLYRRALAIREQALGAEHPDVATNLNNLAGLYNAQNRYAEAEPLYQRALAIREQTLGAEHPDVATSLNNLAGLYYNQGKYTEAEPLYQRALAIRKKSLGVVHPNVAISLNNLAGLYYNQGKYTEAEPLYQETLKIYEKTIGPDDPGITGILMNYAALLRQLRRKDEAEKLVARAKKIQEEYAQKNLQ